MVNGAVYVPNPDDKEMRETAEALQQAYVLEKVKPEVFFGTKQTLGDLAPDRRLYVIGHGDVAGQLTLKTGNPNRWTAAELASQLVTDGLTTQLQSLELLVCNAAKFPAPNDKLAKLKGIRDEARKVLDGSSLADPKTDPKFVALSDKYDRKEGRYEARRKYWKGEVRSGMVEPFAFGLKLSLVKLNFSQKLKVYAYNFSVAKTFRSGAIHVFAPDSREATDSDIVEF
jgi:hypothetical protein